MSSGLAPWLGLAGVVVGGLVALLSTTLQDWRRQRFDRETHDRQRELEDQRRFEQRRFKAFVELITAGNRVYACCRNPLVDEARRTEQIYSAHEQFLATMSPAFLLTSSSQTRDRLADLARKIRDLINYSVVEVGNSDEKRRLLDAHRETIILLEQAMREELGMTAP
jgi:hypothetical protein